MKLRRDLSLLGNYMEKKPVGLFSNGEDGSSHVTKGISQSNCTFFSSENQYKTGVTMVGMSVVMLITWIALILSNVLTLGFGLPVAIIIFGLIGATMADTADLPNESSMVLV